VKRRWFYEDVLVPGLALVVVFFTVQDLPTAWRAAHGGGRPGTFVALERSCGHHSHCGFYGDYESADRTVRLAHVWLDEPPRDLVVEGSTDVVWVHGRDPQVVFRARGSYEWLLIAGLLVAALGALGWTAWRWLWR
jgi:hypothetical protein